MATPRLSVVFGGGGYAWPGHFRSGAVQAIVETNFWEVSVEWMLA